MSTLLEKIPRPGIVYPESDGKPMAENTLQYEWIVTIKGNLDAILPNDFVAGDLFWYPVEGNPKIVQAPDVMVALGRPKGHRASYKQWEENNIAPQVVFEILSPANRPLEMGKKQIFYDHYGVSEYYLYDPDNNEFLGLIRIEGRLQEVPNLTEWISPSLGIRFQLTAKELEIYRPNGDKFLSFAELEQLANQAKEAQAQAKEAQAQAKEAQAQAKEAQEQLLKEKVEKELLKQKLRELGVDPDQLGK
jgi:Uma2 family endonuclease